MQYPSRSDYLNAIRYPQLAFRKKSPFGQFEHDLEESLVTGKAIEKVSPMGMKSLWSASGSCAIVFKYQTILPPKLWAIRCFYRSSFEVVKHYKKSLKHLANNPCRQYFVDCFFLEEGIRVLGKCYPLLKMEWVEGQNLKKFLKENLNNKARLLELASAFYQLSKDLFNNGIAHGDLQHGNLIILPQSYQVSIKLIDYDSLYFTKESDQFYDSIKGLSDYQHPLRQSLEKRCLGIDFFPQLVIYLSILGLAENPRLWNSYHLDEREGLLFSSTDFLHFQSADIFKSLSHLSSPIPTLADKLKMICQVESFENIPSLPQFLSDKPIILPQKITVFQQVNSTLNSLSNIQVKLGKRTLPKIQSLKIQWESKIQQTQNLFEQLSQENLSQLRTFPEQLSRETLIKIQSLKTQWESQIQQIQNLFEQLSQENLSQLRTFPEQLSQETLIKIQSLKTQWESQIQKTQNLFEQLSQENLSQLQNLTHEIREKIESLTSAFDEEEVYSMVSDSSQEKQTFLGVQLQLTREMQEQIKTLKQQLDTPIWTTEEIVSILECSPNWCYEQLEQSDHQFSIGKDYFQDEQGKIVWTKTGFYYLKKLSLNCSKKALLLGYLSTQEVSHRLGVSQAWILRAKVNYAAHLQEGIHYRVRVVNNQKHYDWSDEGVAYLQQLYQLIYPVK